MLDYYYNYHNYMHHYYSFWKNLAECHKSRVHLVLKLISVANVDKQPVLILFQTLVPYFTRTNKQFKQSCLDLQNTTDDIRKGEIMAKNVEYIYI